MAVFSRIVVLAACVVSSALFVDATTENVNAGGQVTARHLKNSQPRAHHAHVAHAHAARSSKKRSADKKRACAAKNNTASLSQTTTDASSSTTDASSSTTTTTTTTKKHTYTTTTTTEKQTTTTTKAAQSTPDNNNNQPAPTGGKAGLAWNDGNEPFMKNLLTTGKVTWCYTWSPWKPGSGCEFVPMLWSGKQIGDWNDQVAGKTFKNVLAFNEPEIGGQSEMSVGEAVSLWHQYVKPMNARHGAPAVTTSPKGIAWISDFIDQCGPDCNIDFLCFHYYGMDPDDFISTIQSLHSKFGKKIWVTEWACQNYGSNQDQQCSLSTVKSFMAKTQAFLDGADFIERYAWFGPLTQFPGGFNTLNRLITPGGAINDLGDQYIAW